MPISVGSVEVEIVPSTRNFRRDLDAKTRDLSVDVSVRLRDAMFDTELARATRARTVDVRVDDKGSANVLLTTLLGLAPAVAPLAAVAAGGTAALGGLGAAGILAFKGIQAEMAAGTPVGEQYTGMLGTLKADLSSLEKTAATGVLTGFTQAASVANGAVPQLRTEVGLLSRSLGSDLAPVTAGVLGLLHDLDPTVNRITGGVHNLATDFEGWATGPGGVKFANYLATELPQVEAVLGALATTGAHLVTSLLPLGGPVLGAIEGISTAINKLPVGVVEGLFVAFEGYQVLKFAGTATKAYEAVLDTLGITASRTALQLDGLAASETAAGRAAATGGLVQKFGPLALASGLGVGALKTLPLYGVGAQSDTLKSPPERAAANFAAEHPNAGPKDFTNFVASAATNPKAAAQLKQYESANYRAKAATDSLTGSVTANTSALGSQSIAMGKLITTSDKLATAALGVAGANINAHQAISDANTALKANGKTLDLNTQKGRDNKTALLNLATALHSKVDADAAAGKSQKTINADLSNGQLQLIAMGRKFGLGETAANHYAKALLGIPNNVLTTVTVNGLAKSAAQIAALKRSEGSLQFFANQKGHAAGGLITGPGTNTSDSIMTPTSNGEFVIQAAAVKQLGVPFLSALNQWKPQTAYAMPPAPHVSASGGMPSTLVVVDVDGQLIGRMRVEASHVTGAALNQSARAVGPRR